MKNKITQAPSASPLRLETVNGELILELSATEVDRHRRLHTHLAREDPLPRRLGLIAALREEGVTTVALSLGAVMAHDLEYRFCVLELNSWWPELAARAQMELAPGLTEITRREVTPEQALRPTGMENLWLLPAGASEASERPRMARDHALEETLGTLSEQFDHLLLDIPAILATGDAVPLAAQADALCLIIRQGVTPLPLIRRALDEVEHLPIQGVILNGDEAATPRWLLRLLPGVDAL